ncbi:MAG: ribosome small subunit-dependent GTPase A [Bacteroidales bacterium]|nr:ribosome small subunit-dependent GTPase A [Bacteroidales bacterium]
MKNVQATVVKHTGSHYLLSILPAWELFPAVIRGKVRLQKSTATNPVAVGDNVLCEVPDDVSESNPAIITEVLPRRNYVIRKSTNLSREAHIIASNIDRAFVVVTLAFPEVKLPFLDRLLVTCEVYGVHVTIVLNKIDLLRKAGADDLIAAFHDTYGRLAGYDIIETSAKTGEGIDALRQALAGSFIYTATGCQNPDCTGALARRPKTFFSRVASGSTESILMLSARAAGLKPVGPASKNSLVCLADAPGESSLETGINLLSGVSGVGKSSLIKALDPSLNPKTAQISLSHLQGRHTTTFYEMYPLQSGGFIIDTPGIRSFGLLDLQPEEIALYFPEMLRESQGCRFTPCTHTHEPGCAVKKAVDEGRISADRYNSYLGMLEENTKYRQK